MARLPKAVRDEIETALAHIIKSRDHLGGIGEKAYLPDDARGYYDSWVISYLDDVLRWDDGKIDANNLSSVRFPSQVERLADLDRRY